ncbi:MAG TPA: hypothetical protein VFG59_11790 [Anaeromyxobacter sp.]|nr:hypothetical protein [Anaeromyxobacter sp.]
MCVSITPAAKPSTLNVQVSSSFLVEDARRIGAAIARVLPGTEVDIDFRQVVHFQGPALACLAEAMCSDRARVLVHGIPDHERKLLGYLGAPSTAARGEPGGTR